MRDVKGERGMCCELLSRVGNDLMFVWFSVCGERERQAP